MSSPTTNALLDMLSGPVLEQLSGQIGGDPAATKKAVQAALPALIGAMGKNASQPEGAEALFKAIKRDHDGSVLQDLGGFINSGGNVEDGNGILRHVLGAGRTTVEQQVARSSGLSAGSAGNLLAILAPILMGGLGKQVNDNGLDAGGLAKVLIGVLGGNGQAGSVIGSLLGMLGGDTLNQLGRQVGLDAATTQKVIQIALPVLIGAMGRKAQQPGGATNLVTAASQNAGLLDDVTGYVRKGGTSAAAGSELGDLLGSKRSAIEKGIAKEAGISSDAVSKLLSLLAPLVLGAMSKQAGGASGGLDAGSLLKVLSGERQQVESQMGSFAKFLDFNGDGSIWDDILGFIMKLLGGRR